MQAQPGHTNLEDILELDDAPAAHEAVFETAVIEKQTVASESATAPAAPMPARVIKMKREEFEAVITSDDIEKGKR